MTSSLAGFIADGNDQQTWDDAIAAVLAALAADFDLLPERGTVSTPSGRSRTTWPTMICTGSQRRTFTSPATLPHRRRRPRTTTSTRGRSSSGARMT